MRRSRLAGFFLSLAAFAIVRPAPALELTQIIPREDPAFQVASSRLAVGRDGRVYLASSAYVLRIGRDGSHKQGSHALSTAITMVAANADGVIATASAHFQHSINVWNRDFSKLGSVSDFLVNDQVQWQAPSDVEAGASGDFYGIDQNRARIVRVGVGGAGRIVATYSLAQLGETLTGKWPRFRVSERRHRFYVLCPSGKIRAIGLDGAPLWSVASGLGGDAWSGWRGDFDVDDDGRLLLLKDASDTMQIYDVDGRPTAELKLKMGERKGRVSDLRVFGDDVILKRPSATELFQVYDRTSGALRRVVLADAEQLEITLGSDAWIAGVPVALSIRLDAPSMQAKPPSWHVWLRQLGVPEFTELALRDGHVVPPVNGGGLYQLRVSSDGGGGGGDYVVDKVVEVRQPGARGSLSFFTPENRLYFGQGEAIPVSVVLRGQNAADLPTSVHITLQGDGARVVAEAELRLESGKPATFVVRPELTRSLSPGRYVLGASLPGLSVATQSVEIGTGIEQPPSFSVVQYGDYKPAFPTGTLFDAPEKVAEHVGRARKLDINMFVDRLGHGGAGIEHLLDQKLVADEWVPRLTKDPLGVAPEKATLEGPVRQSIAAYGARGVEERAILLYMDAGLPVGTPFDTRTKGQLADAITHVTADLSTYPAFRGWSWAANWWIGKLGAASADGAEEKSAYEAALKKSTQTGAWDPVLDRVSDRMLAYAVDAEQQFRAVLNGTAPDKVSAMTGPYRAVGVIPPLTFRHADEIDLQFQSEQIQPPQVTPNNVDFYKRPGRRAWGHPEVWNDDGTGDMILPTVLQMAMRGADGVGWSGEAGHAFGTSAPSDPRASGPGTLSVHRSLAPLLHDYGPWLTTLQSHDRVAIVVSSRMMRIDTWGKIGGVYFNRLYEAYNASLYAHRPATFVFTEDATPDALSSFRAVLVVGQRVEIDPKLAVALAQARRGGVSIFSDATSRTELVRAFSPLGIGFDRIEQDPSAWQDDSAHERIPRYFEKEATALDGVLGAIVPPVATVNQPGIILTERASGAARFVWAIDNEGTGLDPGLAWRVGLIMSQRLPEVARLGLGAEGSAVYDMFALRRVQPANGTVQADLRTLPARLYAVLPRPIGGVELHAPRRIDGGREIAWSVAVQDDRGKPFAASLPVRLRLVASDRTVLREEMVSTRGKDWVRGVWVAPLRTDGPLSLEAVELVSGTAARLSVAVAPSPRPADLLGAPSARPPGLATLPLVFPASVVGRDRAMGLTSVEERFGPHFKDVALSESDHLVVLGAMNWDHNLYALDLETGNVKWRRRVGHHFAYAPEQVGAGFAVQGFDLATPEGYQLYLLDKEGNADRRFSLYGLPKRATSWAMGSLLLDRIDNFAVSPNAEWVASSGDLGLAVWGRGGRKWWSLDTWRTQREHMLLVAQNATTLVALRGTTAIAYDARSGSELWKTQLADVGTLLGGVVSGDGKTLAFRADTYGGRVFVIRSGKVVSTLPTAADALALSFDGQFLVATTGKQLRAYATAGGLRWTFTGDDILRGPRISSDGRRIAVGSELGTLTVLDAGGARLWQHDYEALPVTRWLHDGDLFVATWMGTAARLDAQYNERWRARPEPTETDLRRKLLEADLTPTTRMEHWGNGALTPAPLTPNLLSQTRALIHVTMSDKREEWQQPIAALTDGNPAPPAKPWLGWTRINYIDSGWRGPLVVDIDTFRTQIRLTGITFAEDPAHPESWLRDVRLQYWDAPQEKWRDGPDLLSNTVTHTHWLAKPIEAARFRLVSTGGGTWPVGNLRLGELVFHGEVLGTSHPDVVAMRSVAVLFDESETALTALARPGRPFVFKHDDAYSGGTSLALTDAGSAVPEGEAPFTGAIRDSDFEIAESPKLGQYRWLQFAWKALAPTTTGASLWVGGAWPTEGGFKIEAGAPSGRPEAVWATARVGEKPPSDWQIVRVDLWKLQHAQHARSVRIRSLLLGAAGGGAAFDQILLGRTEASLEHAARIAR